MRMGRSYSKAEKIRKVIQSIFHMVNKGYHVIAVGWIQPDETVKGGTGWGVELGKLFNRPVSVYDQDRKGWFAWKENSWVAGNAGNHRQHLCRHRNGQSHRRRPRCDPRPFREVLRTCVIRPSLPHHGCSAERPLACFRQIHRIKGDSRGLECQACVF